MSPAPSSDTSRPRLYLIDGYSNIFRAFYAIRNLSSSKGEPTNAVFGFVNMLRKFLRDEEPELLGVALDVSQPTVRSERFADYKAQRKPMPEDLRPQIAVIREVLAAYQIPVLEMAGYEADDVLGTLAAKASGEGYDVVLVSADKDLMQLVTDHVSLLHTGRDKLYDPALVTEDFGVPPSQVVDVLALMGDSSDNIPGVPGIGEKGAKSLIAEHGSLEALLDAADSIQRKSYREGLQEHRDQAFLCQELATIHTDLDVPFDPDDLRLSEPDNQALRELFTRLEFFSLAEEIEPEAAGDLPVAEEVTDPAVWVERMEEMAGDVRVALVGGTDEEPVGLVVGAPSRDGDELLPLLADFRRPEMREAAVTTLSAWFRGDGPGHVGDIERLVGHDLKELLRLCKDPDGDGCEPVPVGLPLLDLMLVSYLIKPSVHGHSLDELALERMHRKVLSAKEAGWEKGYVPPPGDPRLLAFAGERLAVVDGVAGGMDEDLSDDLRKVYREIEEPLMPVLLAMEERGILLDCEFLAAMSRELGLEIGDLEEEVYDIAGERFNLSSSKQLGELLFDRLGLPVLKRTRKTKSYATGAEVLEELSARGHEIADKLLRWRELFKLRSTYVDALPTLVAEDGRLHTTFHQAVAATGRLSSANPNLQNIPIRTEMGQKIRKAFTAPEGRELLVADYSQIELRLLAHIAQEPALIEAFRAGQDIHRATAALVFGGTPELITAEQRRAAKTINFGILYGMSAFGLSNQLHIPKKDADDFIKMYLGRFAGVKQYMDDTLASAKEEGKVTTLYGRVRWLPDIRSKNWNVRGNAERMAINARIQGTAADLMKIAMIRVSDRLRDEAPEAQLLLTVHDELVLEVPAEDAETLSELVKEEMEGVCELDVPLVVDVGHGRTWYDAKD
jgi:DNA polymerase I